MTDRLSPADLGTHLLIDHFGGQGLDDPEFVERALVRAAELSGAHILFQSAKTFPGGGVTGFVLLSESHISIHTWPEHAAAAIDIFMCGKSDPDVAARELERAFGPASSNITRIVRGVPSETSAPSPPRNSQRERAG